jgi:hypothetical protein
MEKRVANDSAAPADWWWIFDPRCSLRARAALIFGGGVLLFTLLTAWIASEFLQRQLNATLGANFETLATQVSDKIDRTVYERYRELQFVASLPQFRDPSVGPAERRRVLDALRASSRDFAWIGFADPAGHIAGASGGVFDGARVADRSWFRSAHERLFVGSVHDMPALLEAGLTTEGEGGRVFDLAVPVTGGSGQFVGVLGAHVRWEWAREMQLSVVPEAARRELVGVTIYAANNDVLLDSGGSGWTEPPAAPALNPRQFRGTLRETTSDGASYLTGFMRSRGSREFRGLGWLVVVRQPFARAFAPVGDLRHSIVRWGLLFTLAMLLLSWWFGARLARWTRSMALAANRIREGDILTVMPRARGDLEMDRMCEAVGNLVEELRPKNPKATGSEALPAQPPVSGYIKPTGSDPRRVIW